MFLRFGGYQVRERVIRAPSEASLNVNDIVRFDS